MAEKKRYRLYLLSIMCLAASPALRADMLREGREAFMNYDFDLASELYAKYAKSLKKNTDPEVMNLLEKFERQLEIAENSLDNVQKIEVIDRIDVPADAFFKAIKLPTNGGKLLPPDAPILKKRRNDSDFIFSTEEGDVMMWSEIDENSVGSIMQSELLLDGTWETPVKAGDILNDGGNVRNPFMLTDGVTLYFAGDGDGSMGGYDIFVATKDPVSGEFRQPIGVGFPFNSPHNEYMMAIDEENGIGWWVTDRNSQDGEVSVYVYKTNDVRSNYQLDDEDDIIPYAQLEDITITQNPNTDYRKILKDIDKRNQAVASTNASDFIFPLPGGRVARRLSDFKSSAARKNMEQYLKAEAEFNSECEKLSSLRRKYHQSGNKKGTSTAIADQIKDLEKKTDWQRERLKQMRNNIIAAEVNK